MNTSRTDAPSLRFGAVRVLKGRHAGKIGYYDDDEGDHAVVYFGEPISSGYVLIERDHLVVPQFDSAAATRRPLD